MCLYNLALIFLFQPSPRTEIRKHKWGAADAVEATPDILSGDEFRWFWVTFEEKNGGLIEFGAGNVVGVDRYEFNSF